MSRRVVNSTNITSLVYQEFDDNHIYWESSIIDLRLVNIFPKLEKITIRKCPILTETLENIDKLDQLKYINIKKYGKAIPIDIKPLEQLKNLTVLKMGYGVYPNDKLETIKKCKNIRNLYLTCGYDITESDIVDLIELTNLERLHINCVPRNIFEVVSEIPTLTSLYLTTVCRPVPMPNLLKLKIRLRDNQLDYVSMFPSLKHLNISIDTIKSVLSIDFSWLKHLSNLRSLKIHGIGYVYDSSHLSRLSKLTRLHVFGILIPDINNLRSNKKIKDIYLEENCSLFVRNYYVRDMYIRKKYGLVSKKYSEAYYDKLCSLEIEKDLDTRFDIFISDLSACTRIKSFTSNYIHYGLQSISSWNDLEHLSLSNNTINIQQTLINANKLKSLSFNTCIINNACNIKTPCLCTLTITSSDINNLNLDNMPNLINIHISNTSTMTITSTMETKLKDIQLFNIPINTIDNIIAPNLVNLDISRTCIKSCNLTKYPMIKKLDVSFSKINNLNGLDTLIHLEELIINGCNLKTLDNIVSTKIKKLYASNCGLTHIPFEKFLKLKKLIISNNPINSIDRITKCHNICMLDIHGTDISDLSPICKLFSLEMLFYDYKILHKQDDETRTFVKKISNHGNMN